MTWTGPRFVTVGDLTEYAETARRQRRQFTKEFKAQVVERVRSGGRTVASVAAELDLNRNSVSAWVHQATVDAGKGGVGALTTEERAELTRLRREVKSLVLEREFLKRTAQLFARGGR